LGHEDNKVVIGPAGNRAMVRVSWGHGRCGVRMHMRVVSYTLSMYFQPDQYPRTEDN